MTTIPPQEPRWGRVAVAVLFLLTTLIADASTEFRAPRSYRPEFVDGPVRRREYSFAVHPLDNPVGLFAKYGPLVEYLNAHIPEARFRLEAARDYADFERRLNSREFDIALPNPYQALLATAHGYRVFAKMGDDDEFRGVILVRRDSGLDGVRELRGRRVAFTARTALAATLLPQFHLRRQGLDVAEDIESLYVGSHDSVIQNTWLGFTDAGATWAQTWSRFQKEHPDKARDFKVLLRTDSLPNNAVIARDDFPAELRERVGRLLVDLDEDPKGRQLLGALHLSEFETASENTYQPVRDFLRRFESEVRPLAQRGGP